MAQNDEVVVKFKGDLKDLEKGLRSLKSQLKDVEKGVSNTTSKIQSDTKKASSGFDGLGNSINQVSRELPAFTVSAQTGFLAISNNLPILVDNFQRVRKETGSVGSAFKQLAGAIFSFQTAMSLGITLLVVYSKDIVNFIGSLKIFNKELSEAEKTQKVLNDINIKASEIMVEEKVKLDILVKSAKEDIIARKERSTALDTLQKMYPAYFNNMSTEKTTLGELEVAHLNVANAILSKAKAQASYEKIVENEKRINELNELIKKEQESIKQQEDFTAKQAAKAVTSTNVFSALANGIIALGSAGKELYDQSTLDALSNELFELNKQNQELSKGAQDYVEKTTNPKTGIPKLQGAYAQLRSEISQLETIIKDSITKDGFASDKHIDKLERLQNNLKQIDEEYQRIQLSIGDVKPIDVLGINTQGFGFEVKPELVGLDLNTVSNTTSNIQSQFEELIANLTSLWEQYGYFAMDIINNIAQMQQNQTQAEINRLEELKNARVDTLDQELKQKLISEKEYTEKKFEIEKKLDAQIKELKREQAVREKQLALFNAGIQGAISIIKASNTAERILTAIAVATQLGVIASTPIPVFEKGGIVKGKTHKQGGVLAELEGGEYVVNKRATASYKDEVEAINKGTFDKIINKKYIIPALKEERKRYEQRIEAVFNDSKLLASDTETRKILKSIDKKLNKGKLNYRLNNV